LDDEAVGSTRVQADLSGNRWMSDQKTPKAKRSHPFRDVAVAKYNSYFENDTPMILHKRRWWPLFAAIALIVLSWLSAR